ncbi:MAG: cell wall-binding repeat-containing protein [Clostridioides sp.]|nr:cell wall-binding repeat-containing protein [Clostridioides sp.]
MKIKQKFLALGLSISIVLGNIGSINALDTVSTIEGTDRYETAGLVADKLTYDTAILVNSDRTLADGLSASGLAGVVKAPILLSKENVLPKATSSRLGNVKKIYIIGGYDMISHEIEDSLKAQGIEIKRIEGDDRIKTSLYVADEIAKLKKIDKVIFTNGFKGEADAMSVSPVAVRDQAPIILTNGQSTSFDSKDMESYVLGSADVMSDSLVADTNATRLGGVNRFETNKKVIQQFFKSPTSFYITKSHILVDSLTGSTIAGESPIVLVNTMSDKSILKGARSLTTLGSLDRVTLQRSINATDPKDMYNKDALNKELMILLQYNDKVSFELCKEENANYIDLAKSYNGTLQNLYEEHLMINSNSVIYNKVTTLITQEIDLNNALVRDDLDAATELSQMILDTITEIDALQ